MKTSGKKRSKLAFLSLAGVLAVALMAGTWAYFSQTMTAKNEFKTGDYKTTLTEEFTPPDKWVPGVTTTKDVKVKNEGNVDVVVRAKLTDEWVRLKDIVDANGNTVGHAGDSLGNTFQANGNTEDAAQKVLGAAYAGTWDGTTALSAYANKWLYYQGYYYFIGVLHQNNVTSSLITGVTMNPLLDNKIAGTYTTVTANEDGTTSRTTTVEQGQYGYDSAKYTLTITANTVQASPNAIAAEFGPGTNGIIDYLKNQATIQD